MDYAKPFTLILALSLAGGPVSAQGTRRQLEAHAHGSGRLTIALENNRLQIELEAPANDVVGFEHVPRTAAQKKAIADAKARLARPGEVFKLSPEAGCKLGSGDVELIGAAGAAGKRAHDHGHNPDKAAKAGTKSAAKEPAKSAEETGGHSEFRATYSLDCSDSAKLRSIAFEYFKTFKGAEKLDVTVIGPKGQSQSVVPRAKPVLDLAGTM